MTILAGFVNIAFRDTQHILEVVFQILFYLTPIIYRRKDITSPQDRLGVGSQPAGALH